MCWRHHVSKCPLSVSEPPQKTHPVVISAGSIIPWVESSFLCFHLSPESRLAYTAFMLMSPKGISVAVSGVMLFRIRCWKEISMRSSFTLELINNISKPFPNGCNKNTTGLSYTSYYFLRLQGRNVAG